MCVSVVGRVMRTSAEGAVVALDGATRTISTALRPEAQPGDFVIVQTGLILDIISAEEAAELERFKQELGAWLDDAE